jgi:hypothetical protein
MRCVILKAAFVTCIKAGLGRPRDAHYLVALGMSIRMGFFGLLRPGELSKLQKRDVKIPPLWAESCSVVIAVADPKIEVG